MGNEYESLFSDEALNQYDSLFADDTTGSSQDKDPWGQPDIERAAELKKKELFRKGKLQYEDDGTLINDSNAMIRAKEVANAGIRGTDWLLEASENIADFGQGDWIEHYDGFMAENKGRRYSMDNKDFIAARALGDNATEQLIQQYKSATHDPNADKGVYTLRKFDGYNPDGSTKYIYKYGLAEVGADTRYRDQWVEDGFDIVEEKRFAGAEDWEKTWNASQGVLDHRVLDNSIDKVQDFDGNWVTRDEASGIKFGSGKTELLDTDLLGTDIGKTQADYDQNRAYSERLSRMADAKWQSGMSDSVVDAIQSGGAKLAVDTADFLLDVITPFGDNTLLNNAKKQENIDKWVGYDRTQSTQALSDAATFWNQGNYLDAIKMVVTDPNTMAESIPMMIAMMAPIPGTRVGKVAQVLKQIDKAEKAGASASKLLRLEEAFKKEALLGLPTKEADKLLTTYKTMKEAPAKMKILDHFAKNAGFHTVVGEMTNNVLDDRIAEKIANGEPGSVDMEEVLGVYALQLPLLAIDRLSFKSILGLGKEGKALKLAFGSLDEAGKKQVLTAIAKKAGEMVASGAAEGAQEYVQTWGEILGAKALVGNKSIQNVLDDSQNQREALMGGLGGLGAGVQMHGIGHGIPDVVRGGQKAYDMYMEDDSTKGMRKVNNLADFNANKDIVSSELGNAIVNQIIEPEYNKIQDFDIEDLGSFKKVIKSMLDRRMQNAFGRDGTAEEGRYQVNEILGRALDAAMLNFSKDQDRTKLNRVLKLIKQANDDKDIDFDSTELAKERNNELFEKFIALTNKQYKPSNTGSESAEMTGNEELGEASKADIDRQRKEDYEALLAEINSQILVDVLTRQGSSVDMDEEGNVKYDKKLFDEQKGLNAQKLKEQVETYLAQEGKNFQNVSDEIQKYGYIVYDDSKKGNGVVLKDSMATYDNTLAKEFRDPNNLKLALTKNIGAKKSGTFQKFAKWAKQRADKLGTYSGKGSSWTASALADMESENQWFTKKIQTLQGMLDSHSTEVLKESERSAIQAKLNEAKADLVQAKERTEAHRKQLKTYVEDVLGLEGFDFENPEHVRQLAGVQTNYKEGENGFEFGPMKVKKRKIDSTLEQSQKFMRGRLDGSIPDSKGNFISDPLTSKKGWNGFDNSNVEINTDKDLSGTATGNTGSNKQTANKADQKYIDSRIVTMKSEIRSLTKMLEQHKTAEDGQYKTELEKEIQKSNDTIAKLRQELEAKGLSKKKIKELITGKKPEQKKTEQSKPEPVDYKTNKNKQTYTKTNEQTLAEIVDYIESQETLTDEYINTFIDSVSKVVSTVNDYTGSEITKDTERMINKIVDRIDKQKNDIDKLQTELREARTRRKQGGKEIDTEYKNTIRRLLGKVADGIKTLYRLITGFGKIAYKKIADVEIKSKLVKDLKAVQQMMTEGKDKESILKEIEGLKQDYTDANRLIMVAKKVGKDIKNNKAVEKIYKRIEKRLRRFKSYTGTNTYIDKQTRSESKQEAKQSAKTKQKDTAGSSGQTATNTENDTINVDEAKMDKEEELLANGFEEAEKQQESDAYEKLSDEEIKELTKKTLEQENNELGKC